MLRLSCLVAALGFMLAGCGAVDETCSAVQTSCEGGKTYEACCSNSGATCLYRFSDDTEFDCNGSDCSAAAQEAANYCLNG